MYACVLVFMCTTDMYPWKPEDSAGAMRAGVRGGCELSVVETEPGSLAKAAWSYLPSPFNSFYDQILPSFLNRSVIHS